MIVVTVILCVVAAALGRNGSAASSGVETGSSSSGSGAPDAPSVLDGTGDAAADGAVPEGATVFDDQLPAVANLDADLLHAVRRAARAAAADEVTLHVNSGWRSAEYQERLLRDAIAQYGSAEEAARWVATADTSPHVDGDAIDVGPWDARDWLAQHGADYGLCQIYGNEPWHYELRPEAVDEGCPAVFADPTRDPRMRR
ncbi:M15 family metallopeptidase [Microbacteriaceae bacterium 4G12]